MNLLASTFVGFAWFFAMFVLAQYVYRMLAIKLHAKGSGQGLGALVF